MDGSDTRQLHEQISWVSQGTYLVGKVKYLRYRKGTLRSLLLNFALLSTWWNKGLDHLEIKIQ